MSNKETVVAKAQNNAAIIFFELQRSMDDGDWFNAVACLSRLTQLGVNITFDESSNTTKISV